MLPPKNRAAIWDTANKLYPTFADLLAKTQEMIQDAIDAKNGVGPMDLNDMGTEEDKRKAESSPWSIRYTMSQDEMDEVNSKTEDLDVQVIGSDGGNLGAMPLNKAIELAKQEGLDLIEISPNANPPVCKIMDMGKYKYDLQKKANLAKKKNKKQFR